MALDVQPIWPSPSPEVNLRYRAVAKTERQIACEACPCFPFHSNREFDNFPKAIDSSDVKSLQITQGVIFMWHISRNGKSTGPFSEDQIKQLVREGRVFGADLVWKQGMSEWSTAAAVFGIKEPKLPPVPPRAPDTSSGQGNHPTNPYGEMASAPAPFSKQIPSSETSKLGAALLAIFLGGLGIHKFYLGYQTAGIIMLAITLLSCGFGVVVIGIVGIIEGIIYISKTDEEFHLAYVVGRKEWF